MARKKTCPDSRCAREEYCEAWSKGQTGCSSDGCTNQAKKGGVCKRHGAYRNPNDESTAFTLSSSAFERTTATLPHYRAREADIHSVVTIVCGVVTAETEEV